MLTNLRAPGRRRLLAALLVSATALTACGSSSPDSTTKNTAYTVVSTPQLVAGDLLPPPAGDVVLTVSGKITRTNVGDTAAFDLATLESLGLVEFSVNDRQAEGKVVTFRGVLVSELLKFVGADPAAVTLHAVALNDYAVDIPTSDVTSYPVMIATAVDGQRMPVARFGPTRIVYPASSYDFDPALYEPRWIWQLAAIDVV